MLKIITIATSIFIALAILGALFYGTTVNATTIAMAKDETTGSHRVVWINNGKKEICVQFSGGNCLEKEDVTDRFVVKDTSSGTDYVIRKK